MGNWKLEIFIHFIPLQHGIAAIAAGYSEINLLQWIIKV